MSKKKSDYIKLPEAMSPVRSDRSIVIAIKELLSRIGVQKFTAYQITKVLEEEGFIFRKTTKSRAELISNNLIKLEKKGFIMVISRGKGNLPNVYMVNKPPGRQ